MGEAKHFALRFRAPPVFSMVDGWSIQLFGKALEPWGLDVS